MTRLEEIQAHHELAAAALGTLLDGMVESDDMEQKLKGAAAILQSYEAHHEMEMDLIRRIEELEAR